DSFLILHAVLMGTFGAIIFVFANEAPYIGIETMGMSADMYGLFNLLIPFGAVLGLVMVNRLAGKALPRVAMLMGILIALIGVLFMAICFLKKWMTGWSLFL